MPRRNARSAPWPEPRPLPWQYLARADARFGFSTWLPDSSDAILLYHSVGGSPEFDYQWDLSREGFRNQLRALSRRFDFVDLNRIVNHPYENRKRLAITFDDGFRNVRTAALPILQEFAAPATVFVSPGLISEQSPDKLQEVHGIDDASPDLWLSFEELRTLARSDLITIGNHTATHPDLAELTEQAQLVSEIIGAKEELERRLGVTIDRFSYPYGRRTDQAAGIIERSHEMALTSTPGLVTPRTGAFDLPRLDACQPTEVLLFETSMMSHRLRQIVRRLDR